MKLRTTPPPSLNTSLCLPPSAVTVTTHNLQIILAFMSTRCNMRWSESVYNHHNTSASPPPHTHLTSPALCHTHPSLPQYCVTYTRTHLTSPALYLTQPPPNHIASLHYTDSVLLSPLDICTSRKKQHHICG